MLAPEKGTIEYKYQDETGAHLFTICRQDTAEGKKIWMQAVNGFDLKLSKDRYPYHLPEVLQGIHDIGEVFICEGEKCTDTLRALGLTVTCNAGGAGKWTDEHSQWFKHTVPVNVVILPDNDEPGRNHALKVATSLYAVGCKVKIVDLPGLKEKEDVYDWLQAGNSIENLIQLVESTPVWENKAPYEVNVFVPAWDNEPEDHKPLVELANVKILSPGNISMITAGAGAGKSSLLEAGCASAVSFDADSLGLRFQAETVLYVDSERCHADHHRSWRRFMRRCGYTSGAPSPDFIKWENIRGIDSLQDRLSYLWQRIDTDNAPELVLIDGIGDFIADPNDSEECTALIYKLCSIVHNRGIGILLTLHTNPAVNTTKARGVLGSELWRKCESTLIIEKLEDGIRRVTTDYSMGKNRSASDTVFSSFKWDDELKMHVSCDAPAEVQCSGKITKQRESVLELMKNQKFTHTELKVLIMDKYSVSDKTARNRIGELVEMGKIRKTGNLYEVTQND